MNCIIEMTKIGCTILNIAGDMGIMNQGLFSDCGMKCKRQYSFRTENNIMYRQCNFSFCISMPNPISKEPIYFTHDPMDLCKTVRNNFLHYDIYVSNEVLQFFNIHSISNLISFNWVREFAKVQNSDLCQRIELRDYHLNPNTFQKMNVEKFLLECYFILKNKFFLKKRVLLLFL